MINEFETGAVRDTGGKGRMDLLPWCALIRVSKHMEDALTHYPERNWEKGLPMHSMIDSAFRHLAKYVDGWTDEDHLCAATTNLLMAMWTEEKKPELQDIPSKTDLSRKASPLPSPGLERSEGPETPSSIQKPEESHGEATESMSCMFYHGGRCIETTGEVPCGGYPYRCLL